MKINHPESIALIGARTHELARDGSVLLSSFKLELHFPKVGCDSRRSRNDSPYPNGSYFSRRYQTGKCATSYSKIIVGVYEIAVVTNDSYTKKDAEYLVKNPLLAADSI